MQSASASLLPPARRLPPSGVASGADNDGDGGDADGFGLVLAACEAVARAAPSALPPSLLWQLHSQQDTAGRLASAGDLLELLGDALIAMSVEEARSLPEDALRAVDAVWSARESVVPAVEPTPEGLPDALWALAQGAAAASRTALALWRGDIRTLRAGAIVNAANADGCGCFRPEHRCVDNVVHRAAGPRLRVECAEVMDRRGWGSLVAGSPPIVTSGHHLPAERVVHVTGPQLARGQRAPTASEKRLLAAAYAQPLDAAAADGARTVAFPCISAGLFAFPTAAAARVATDAVLDWLADPAHSGALDAVVFVVFTDADQQAYESIFSSRLLPLSTADAADTVGDDVADAAAAFDDADSAAANSASPMLLAPSPEAEALAGADRLLIVAAAGLSIHDTLPNNVYHNADHFRLHYPQAAKHGYRTGYEAMSLSTDARVPEGVRVAHTAAHFLNMRQNFPPTPAYRWLRRLADTFRPDQVFAWTSNVDGCFERAGFPRERVYTSQGEMSRMQCDNGHVWDCTEQLRRIVDASPEGVLTDMSLRVRCPKCGSARVKPNLRGGDWFNHAPYVATQQALIDWMDEAVAKRLSVAVIEVGVGSNTPVVTRIPASAFASAVGAAGGRAAYLRVNPDAHDLHHYGGYPAGSNVRLFNRRAGWQVLEPVVNEVVALRRAAAPRASDKVDGVGQGSGGAAGREVGGAASEHRASYLDILTSLRTPRA